MQAPLKMMCLELGTINAIFCSPWSKKKKGKIIRANALAVLPLWQDIHPFHQLYELGVPILWMGATETREPAPSLSL